MIILSEVKPGTKPRILSIFLTAAIALFPFPFSTQAARSDSVAPAPSNTADRLNDCNWMVNYRGRTYDLSPLTREALSRPIETDIRYALQRVPESAQHLEKMSTKLKEARAHTILASIFVSGFLVGKILQSQQRDEEQRKSYNVITQATGLFFIGSTVFSWKATRDAKRELVSAVDAFNANSPHKIEPITAPKNELEFLDSKNPQP